VLCSFSPQTAALLQWVDLRLGKNPTRIPAMAHLAE
jgi:hypothetical protein